MAAGRKNKLLFRLFYSEKLPPVAKTSCFFACFKRKMAAGRKNKCIFARFKAKNGGGSKNKCFFACLKAKNGRRSQKIIAFSFVLKRKMAAGRKKKMLFRLF